MSAFGSVKTISYLTSASTVGIDLVQKTDDAATATNRTYSPVGYVQNGMVAKWEDRSGGIQVGYPNFSLSVRPPVNGSRINRVTLALHLPTLEQTSASTASGIQPAPTKAYECSAKLEFMLPERSARWERIALYQSLVSLLMATITASDGAPSDATASPLAAAVFDYEKPY